MNALIKFALVLLLAIAGISTAVFAFTELTTRIYTLEVLGDSADARFTKDLYK